MRLARFVLLMFLASGFAAAQTVSAHQGTVAPAAAAPPKPPVSTIIPGSPLATLTGAGAGTPTTGPDVDTQSPFGSRNLGLSVTSVVGADTERTLSTFSKAVRHSTNLEPVAAWARTVVSNPYRRADAMDMGKGLAIALLPAWLLELILFLGLARLRAMVAGRAARQAALLEDSPGGQARPAAAPAPPETALDEPDLQHHRKRSFKAWFLRLLLALLHLGLAVLPIAGFAIAGGVLLGLGIITARPARLAIVVVSNAYLLSRLILEALRFLFSPGVPALRLVAMPDRRASWIFVWAKILLFSGAAGYGLISLCEIIGLDAAGTRVLISLAALVAHIEVATMIWQGRRVVRRWIAGDPRATGSGTLLRRQFGRVWHYFALFYVLALWIALAGGVQHAFGVLLRVVLVVFAAGLIGRLAWIGSAHLLERLFPESKASESRHAAFYTRARIYNPLVSTVIRVFILVAVAVSILQGWGFHVLAWLLHNNLSRALTSAVISILITATVALVLWEICNGWINNRIAGLSSAGRTRQASRLRTLLPILRATIGVAIAIVAGLICLSKIGVNAAPLLAGAGVLGIAIGFGSQKLVQDIITGLFLLIEDAMQVGDVINLAGLTGTVEKLSVRTIHLRGGDGSVNIIPFSAVTTVTNMTRDFGYAQISIQVGYEEDLERVSAVLMDIARTMRSEPKWQPMIRDDLQLFGLDQFGASALVITGQIRTGPGQHWAVRREFYARVKARFESEHIDMPYTYLPPAPRVIGQDPGAPPLDPAAAGTPQTP